MAEGLLGWAPLLLRCSWCFRLAVHNVVSRSIVARHRYICTDCHRPTAQCKWEGPDGSRCLERARAHTLYADSHCALHQGLIKYAPPCAAGVVYGALLTRGLCTEQKACGERVSSCSSWDAPPSSMSPVMIRRCVPRHRSHSPAHGQCSPTPPSGRLLPHLQRALFQVPRID